MRRQTKQVVGSTFKAVLGHITFQTNCKQKEACGINCNRALVNDQRIVRSLVIMLGEPHITTPPNNILNEQFSDNPLNMVLLKHYV